MSYAFVTTNLLDLWTEPRFNSERASQLLYGEIVRATQHRQGYRRVYQVDEYTGWVDSRFLTEITDNAARRFNKGSTHVVVSSQVRLFDNAARQTTEPHFLYYGTKLWVTGMVGGLAEVVLPHRGTVLLKAGALRPIDSNMTSSVTGRLIVREAQKFLGTPYLWGGLSPAGFDCSGLVRAIFARFGRYMPRDTRDQINAGHRLPRQCIKSGDLAFFERHVGIAVGRSRIIHASLAGGGVRMNSLVPGTADYREDLDKSYSQARRIL